MKKFNFQVYFAPWGGKYLNLQWPSSSFVQTEYGVATKIQVEPGLSGKGFPSSYKNSNGRRRPERCSYSPERVLQRMSYFNPSRKRKAYPSSPC